MNCHTDRDPLKKIKQGEISTCCFRPKVINGSQNYFLLAFSAGKKSNVL